MSELQELFYQDAYIREFESKVVSCEEGKDGFDVVLEDTAFYPEGGGQPGDRGKIAAAQVLDTRRVNGQVVHVCSKAIRVGRKVKCVIDWARRYDNMQNHTAEHIFSGILHREFGFDNVGFHMDDNVVTCDFDGLLTDEDIARIEELTNTAIQSAVPVNELYPTPEELDAMEYRSKKALTGRVRIVDIPGCDRCACCGTHVKNAAECGMLKVLSRSKHRGGTRVEFLAGGRAMRDYAARVASTRAISALLSAKQSEITQAVEKLLAAQQERDEEIWDLNDRIMDMKVAAVPDEKKLLILIEDGITPAEQRTLAEKFVETGKTPIAAILTPKPDGSWSYVLGGPEDVIREGSKLCNERLEGRGGGKGGFVQGSYKASMRDITIVLKEVFVKGI